MYHIFKIDLFFTFTTCLLVILPLPINMDHTCNSCGKSFHFKDLLKDHQGSHRAARVYFACSQCDKSYSHHHGLEKHKKTHTGEKPFDCSDCNKYFAVPQQLKDHEKKHMGEIFACLMKEIKETPEDPYRSCTLCLLQV